MSDSRKDYELETEESEYTIDLLSLIEDLWKGIKIFGWLVMLLAVVSAVFNCVRTYQSYHPSYTAFATFTVNLSGTSDGSMYEDNLRAAQMSKTFPYIIYSGVLKNMIANDLELAYVSESITAENVENTNLFTIKVSSDNAQRANEVLQSVIKNYPSIAETVVGTTNLTMLDESGVPDTPNNSIDYRDSIKIGILPGIVIGVAIIMIFALTRRTIHKVEDIEKISNIKQLGILPEVVFKKRGNQKNNKISLKNKNLPDSYSESIYKIRTRVEKIANNKHLKSILVTSAIPGEGKSTFAFNLALALAEGGKKVVLMDCDFRRPSIKNMLSLPEDIIGVEDVLNGKAMLKDALHYYDEFNIFALSCKKPISNSSEIIGTTKMHRILLELEELVDYVIIDTAPVAILSDTSDLAKLADGVIFLIKQDYSKTYHILEGLEHLSESSDIEIIGCILNSVHAGLIGYGYGYGYGYGHYGRYGGYGYGRKKDKGEFISSEEG